MGSGPRDVDAAILRLSCSSKLDAIRASEIFGGLVATRVAYLSTSETMFIPKAARKLFCLVMLSLEFIDN